MIDHHLGRKPAFSWLGVPVILRPSAVVPPLLIAGLAFAVARRRGYGVRAALAIAAANMALWAETDLVHTSGHILSARRAGAPMDYVSWGIISSTRYDDNDVAPAQHIGRAVGGPIASGLAALAYWLLWRALRGTPLGPLLASGAIQNALIGGGSLAPLPMVDGGVILENVLKLREQRPSD
jgi:hypothetical protein